VHFGHDDGVTQPTALDDYEFDLRGFLVIRGALSNDEVAALNRAYDQFPELGHGEWYGNAQRRDYTSDTGFELHNVLDCGDPTFDLLIDHPSWVDHARRYAGEAGTYVQGITIDEHIATIREAGGHHPVHSGGHDASIRTQYAMRDGRFRCGQLNVLVALTDIGPGDGATMIVPGSHKANFPHPLAGDYARGDRMDALPFAVEVHANAGDALVFVDACMHGGSSRTTAGERRVIILRYGPPWARPRFGYTLSPEFLDRLTPERRRIMDPIPTMHTGDTRVPLDLHSTYTADT
jgi:ectoine hydroxylase-related dioxygenase (phytanoyl-CoA dioxygenase family)